MIIGLGAAMQPDLVGQARGAEIAVPLATLGMAGDAVLGIDRSRRGSPPPHRCERPLSDSTYSATSSICAAVSMPSTPKRGIRLLRAWSSSALRMPWRMVCLDRVERAAPQPVIVDQARGSRQCAPCPPAPWQPAQLLAKATRPPARAKSRICGSAAICAGVASRSLAIIGALRALASATSPTIASRAIQPEVPFQPGHDG